MSLESLGGTERLLIVGWRVRSIFTVLVKHVSFSRRSCGLEVHGRVCLAARWPAFSLRVPTVVVLGLVHPKVGDVTDQVPTPRC